MTAEDNAMDKANKHRCAFPGCKRRFKRSTWCRWHFSYIPIEFKIGEYLNPQPDALVKAALEWIASDRAMRCSRCANAMDRGWLDVRLGWRWTYWNDLVLQLCRSCSDGIEDALGIRWCEPCNGWTRNTHPVHAKAGDARAKLELVR